MIAICQPAEYQRDESRPDGSQCGGVATIPPRTGSLRRIDEIVGELLAGYALAGEPGEAADLRPGRAYTPAAAIDALPRFDASAVEMLSASPR
jgi:hypothetical protein